MKKLFCGILAAILVCTMLAGCSSSGVPKEEYDKVVSELSSLQKELDELKNNQNSSQEPMEDVPSSSEPSSEPEQSSSADTENESKVLLEKDGIKITFTGIGENYMGPEIKLKIENGSKKAITVQQRDMSINGIMIDGIFSSDVASGKTANDGIGIFSSDLEDNEITEIKNIELSFHIFDSDSWDTILDTENITIEVK